MIDCENHQARAAATRQLRYWHDSFADDGIAHLRNSANDANGIVRMEAANAATYIGTRQALDAILGMLDKPMGDHLKYATSCALGSESLSRHRQSDPTLSQRINRFLESAKPSSSKVAKRKKTASDAQFDTLKGLATIEISCIPERLMYTKTEFTVAPGQPVKLVFTNPDVTAHNLLIVEPGAAEEIGMAGNEMAKDPNGEKRGFIPKSKKILHATKLLKQDEAQTLRFRAPTKPGVLSLPLHLPRALGGDERRDACCQWHPVGFDKPATEGEFHGKSHENTPPSPPRRMQPIHRPVPHQLLR